MRLDRVMDTTPASLTTAFDYVWDRLTSRLALKLWPPITGQTFSAELWTCK